MEPDKLKDNIEALELTLSATIQLFEATTGVKVKHVEFHPLHMTTVSHVKVKFIEDNCNIIELV